MFRKYILFLLLVLMSESVVAIQLPLLQRLDTLTHRSWTLEDGLPVNTVNEIAQDSLGYLWISTYDGLVRFDGLNFKVYNFSNTPVMPHNRSTIIHIQDGVGMWVALEYGGTLLIQDNKFRHFGDNNGFTNSDITKIMEASDGRMFFITHQGLYVFDGTRFSQVYKSEIYRQNQVHDIAEVEDQSILVGTNHGLLHIKDDSMFEYYISPDKKDTRILDVHQTAEGSIIAATDIGLYELDKDKLSLPKKFKTLANKQILSIYEDDEILLYLAKNETYQDKGNSIEIVPDNSLKENEAYFRFHRDQDETLWAIGNSGTLSIFQEGRLEPLNGIEEIKDLYFKNIFEDREGIIWLSSNTNGLINIQRSKVRNIGPPEGLSGDNTLALLEENPGKYWVGTRGHGLNLLEGNDITTFNSVKDGLASNIIQALEIGPEGNVWVGYHQRGIDKVTKDGFQHFKIGTNVESGDVHSIYTSSTGQMWVGTYAGLLKFDPINEQHQYFGIEHGLSGYKIRYITEDEQGALWIGTLDGGVSRYFEGEFTNYTTDNGLSSNNIRSIYVDEYDTGTIWVGTENNGLNRIRNGEITFINTNDGLPDHIVHWISQDDNEWLWTSSNRGIFRIDKTELNEYLDGKTGAFSLLHFGREEGMRNPEANGAVQEAGLRTSSGNFWFATQEGVAIFESESNRAVQVPPKMVINTIISGTDRFTHSDVEISRGQKNFDIQFHALTFASPEKTRFRYRLKGYDQKWTEVIGDRVASYVDVPSGDYTFEVTAANNDGVWSAKPAVATISILPLFYEQFWFYLLSIFIIGVGYYTASQIRYNYLVRKQEQLQQIIEEQTAQLRKEKSEIEEKSKIIKQQAEELEESNKTKDKFFSLIAHDLRNPFQAILGYSELMLDDVEEADRKDLKASLQHIQSSSRSLLELVEHLLSWASLNTGKIQPYPEKVNLKELIERTYKLFENVANQKDVKLVAETIDDLYLNADLNMLQTIMRNVVSNAIKFTTNGREVKTTLTAEDQFYIISVKDSGVGMSKKMIDDLLRLDANTSRAGTNNEKGTGLGLLICREMVNIHNGEIEVESTVGTGTIFTLKFPKEGLPMSLE